MIKSFLISNYATFKDDEETKVKKINFFYGGNGCGKTTISKVISDSSLYPGSKINWESDSLPVLTYNEEFVKKYFADMNEINGIYTFGENSKETLENIKRYNDELSLLNHKLEQDKNSLDKRKTEFAKDKLKFYDDCWEIQNQYKNDFPEILAGTLASKKRFAEKILEHYDCLCSEEDYLNLVGQYKFVFKTKLEERPPFDRFLPIDFKSIECSELLSRSIVGSKNVDMGFLIDKLSNSDWVKEGMSYVENSDGKCPFCQQYISCEVSMRIEEYFDAQYDKQIRALQVFSNNYINTLNSIIDRVDLILLKKDSVLDMTKLLQIRNSLYDRAFKNFEELTIKKNEPGRTVELFTTKELYENLVCEIDGLNNIINKSNLIVSNISNERKEIGLKVWKFLSNTKLGRAIKGYEKIETNFGKSQKALEETIEKSIKEIDLKKLILKNEESKITSIKHTVNFINNALNSFGFNNFKLKEVNDDKFYCIIREDGTSVDKTLSEGEYKFVSFLYFYSLMKGSINASGQLEKKVIVIDDPISSLDSNILFIVSTLVKNIIHDCLRGENGIEQVFILTHNVYFHKEVTFCSAKEKRANAEKAYFIINKNNSISHIIEHHDNPICSSYDLLWKELREISDSNHASIFNSMRRILEYYFNIIGGVNYDDMISKFEGEDLLICKSLIACINDGSHDIIDDFYISPDKETINKYVLVFEKIFIKTNQTSHYNMMMRIEDSCKK